MVYFVIENWHCKAIWSYPSLFNWYSLHHTRFLFFPFPFLKLAPHFPTLTPHRGTLGLTCTPLTGLHPGACAISRPLPHGPDYKEPIAQMWYEVTLITAQCVCVAESFSSQSTTRIRAGNRTVTKSYLTFDHQLANRSPSNDYHRVWVWTFQLSA